MGLSRPGSDAAEVSVCADGPWIGERSIEAKMEMAADSAEQRGLLQSLHTAVGPWCKCMTEILNDSILYTE